MRVVPPHTRRWFEVLPPPFNVEQCVVAVELPISWKVQEGMTKDEKYRVLVATNPEENQLRGLQIVDVKLGKYNEQRVAFADYHTQMAEWQYIGPLSGLPQRLLTNEETTVMLFNRDHMWRKPIDLKRAWTPAEEKC